MIGLLERARRGWIRRAWLAAAAVTLGASGALAQPVCIDFDGSLPPEATLTRGSARLDAAGVLVPANTARFEDTLVGGAARLITSLREDDQVLGVGDVGGTVYTVVASFLTDLWLTSETPLCDVGVSMVTPPASVTSNFGFDGAPWGAPRSAEVFPDGTILIHTSFAGVDLRAATVRTTAAGFGDPGGWALVRVSDYAPPPGADPTFVPISFVRTTTLANLGITVSTIAEYTSLGLVSGVDPGDGRSLGYASCDGGLTWTRIIDTDDPVLGRALVAGAKHLHHLEPFEWYDDVAGQWKIGAVGCLGDSEGESGQIWVRSPLGVFPPEGQNHLLTLERTRVVQRRALTDIFPLDASEGVGEALRFLHGNDGEFAGIVEARVEGGVEENVQRFRPTVPHVRTTQSSFVELPQYPFIFQMDRLGHGSILAATTEASIAGNPNGMWISNAAGDRWTTIRLGDTSGFSGVSPVGTSRFWTQAILGDSPASQEIPSQLWEAPAPVERRAVMLGGDVGFAASFPLYDGVSSIGTVVDVTGVVDGPEVLGGTSAVYRMTSETAGALSVVSSHTAGSLGAAAGEYVYVEHWLKPAPVDAGVIRMQLDVRYESGGQTFNGLRLSVDHRTNMWTRVCVVERAPGAGIDSITVDAVALDAASVALPLDFFFTEPRVFVSSQPVSQAVRVGGEQGDRLSVSLPALGPEWTIGVWGTEAMTLAMSLVEGGGGSVEALSTAVGSFALSRGIDVGLELSSSAGGVHGATSAQDVFVPTQSMVVFRMSQPGDVLEMWVSRGMGDPEVVSAPGVALDPDELRFGAADWSVLFEGMVHRVKVWPVEALGDDAIRRERLAFGAGCSDAPLVDVSEPLFACTPPPPEPCAGDVDGDGDTDVFDFNVLAPNFGMTGLPAWTGGDLDGDGDVDVFDFNVFAPDFGCVEP